MSSNDAKGNNWHLYHGDCVEVSRSLPSNSIDYTIFSPPFESLYTYSDSPQDMSNCRDSKTFWKHFNFLIKELYRLTLPGRLVTIHCMQLPASKVNDGYIGTKDFRGDIIRNFEAAGFIYHSEVCIRKDPVTAMQRTKAIGLLHKQIKKDSSLSRQAFADYMVNMMKVGYIVTMRHDGKNPKPITGRLVHYNGDDQSDGEFSKRLTKASERSSQEHKSIEIWQRYAEPIWMDINQSDTLSGRMAREQADERHIAPLQLTAIKRCVQLWSNKDDIVFSPFAGIGSELYTALTMGRKAVGIELKPSYFKQAVTNLKSITTTKQLGFLDRE
jgi:DNA modification methylase